MKTKNTAALVLALGILSVRASADNTTVLPAYAPSTNAASPPAPAQIASTPQSSSASDSARNSALSGATAKQIAQFEHDFNAKHRPYEGLAQNLTNQVLPGIGASLAKAQAPRVVFSEPPSPAFYYDSNAPAYWYPSISFHFDWGRNRRG
ncbi:MAG TPA: hypothetical protein VMC06_09230 [Opitutaceae bacterium]|nr:hypothetical protein [Opitutaceae bacterium]